MLVFAICALALQLSSERLGVGSPIIVAAVLVIHQDDRSPSPIVVKMTYTYLQKKDLHNNNTLCCV